MSEFDANNALNKTVNNPNDIYNQFASNKTWKPLTEKPAVPEVFADINDPKSWELLPK